MKYLLDFGADMLGITFFLIAAAAICSVVIGIIMGVCYILSLLSPWIAVPFAIFLFLVVITAFVRSFEY